MSGPVQGRLKDRLDHLPLEEKEASALRSPTRDMATDAFPLSYAQERLWFLDQLQPGTATYNIPVELRLPGPLNVAALTWSFNEIVRRHEILRTTFAMQNGKPVQIVVGELKAALAVIDLQGHPTDEREAIAKRLAREEAQRGFDLERGPLLRISLLRLGARDHVLLLTMHHIIGDGWSFEILFQELGILYEAACRGKSSPLAPLPVQYADFAVWQRKRSTETHLAKELEYWRRRLAGAPTELALPTDHVRPAMQSHAGMTLAFQCSKELANALARISRAAGGSLFMVLLAAFKVLLLRYTGQADLVVGTPMANRNRAEIEGLIGFFVNMMVLRTDLSGNPTFRELLRRVKDVTLGAYDHADVPFERVVEELQPNRTLSRNPIFQVVFALQNTSVRPSRTAASPATTAPSGTRPANTNPALAGNGTAKFDLVLAMGQTESGLVGTIEYSTDLFELKTIQLMQRHFVDILQAIADDQEIRVLDIPLRTRPENSSRNSIRCSHGDESEHFHL
jgi:hypothetical protein